MKFVKQTSSLIFSALVFSCAFAATPNLAHAQASFGSAPAGPQTGLRVERLTIATPGGARSFRVEMADTPESREIGMMWRTSVPRGTGMLFDFPAPQNAYFWMENTLSSLDIIFIRSDGTIANIAANAQPLSRAVIPSAGPIKAVLEIGAGEAQRLGIRAGQKVRHRIFTTSNSRR
jgi:uncharacterized protein